MAYRVDTLTKSGFNPTSGCPSGWTYSGGDYAIAVVGDRFLIAERAKLGSLNDLSELLHSGQS